MARYAYLDTPLPIAFAHRGDSASGPENTLPAFAGAVDLGFRYLETDVHLSRDGVLMAHHDESLQRVTGEAGNIDDYDYAALRQFKIAGREDIPTMTALFESFPDARFNIDTKSDASVQPLVDMIKHFNAEDRVCVGSFSGRRIQQLRQQLPTVCTSMGPLAVLQSRLLSVGVNIGQPKAACAQVPVRGYGVPIVDRRFVRSEHANGRQVHVWTINNSYTMNRILDLGVDGVMSDDCRLLKTVLQQRGQWH